MRKIKIIYNFTLMEIGSRLFPKGYQVVTVDKFRQIPDTTLGDSKRLGKLFPRLVEDIPEGANILIGGTVPMTLLFMNKGFIIWYPVIDMETLTVSKIEKYNEGVV